MNKYQKARLLVVTSLIVLLCFGVYMLVSSRQTNILRVVFFDVGQGDSIYIKSPSGGELLVDGGGDKVVLSKLGKYMNLFDRSIDVVIATHPDKDHIGGLPSVLSRYNVGMLLESGAENDNGVNDEIRRVADSKRVRRVSGFAGQKIDLGGGVLFTILYPNKSVVGLETNEASIVGLLSYGDKTFLLTGDAPVSTEYQVLSNLSHLTVLKAGHHGSETSTSFELLEKTTPEITVLSVGAHNTYGHPHRKVTSLLEEFHSKIYRTDTHGDIVFETNGESITAVTQNKTR